MDKDIRRSKNSVDPTLRRKKAGAHLSESDKKKLELDELMQHEHGKNREKLTRDIQKLDKRDEKR